MVFGVYRSNVKIAAVIGITAQNLFCYRIASRSIKGRSANKVSEYYSSELLNEQVAVVSMQDMVQKWLGACYMGVLPKCNNKAYLYDTKGAKIMFESGTIELIVQKMKEKATLEHPYALSWDFTGRYGLGTVNAHMKAVAEELTYVKADVWPTPLHVLFAAQSMVGKSNEATTYDKAVETMGGMARRKKKKRRRLIL